MHPETAIRPNWLESDQALIILFASLRFHSVSPLCASAPLYPPLPHIMLFSRLAGFFQLFREYVCLVFSVPGSLLDVQGTPRLNTLEGNPREMRSAVVNELHGVSPVQLGRWACYSVVVIDWVFRGLKFESDVPPRRGAKKTVFVQALYINDLIRQLHSGYDIEHVGGFSHLFLIQQVKMGKTGATD